MTDELMNDVLGRVFGIERVQMDGSLLVVMTLDSLEIVLVC